MPCDIRLSIFNEMLRCATERQSVNDELLAKCLTRLEEAQEAHCAARDALDRAISDEAKARQPQTDCRQDRNARSDEDSPGIRNRMTDLVNTSQQAASVTLSARAMVRSTEKSLNEARAEFVLGQAAQSRPQQSGSLSLMRSRN